MQLRTWFVSLVSVACFQALLLMQYQTVDAFHLHRLASSKVSNSCNLPTLNRCTYMQAASSSSSVVDRLGLDDSFQRWRFLQRLLDDDACDNDVNQVIYAVLIGFLERPRKKDEVSNEMVSPILNDLNRELVMILLKDDDGTVPVFSDDHIINEQLLEKLERLLPDPVENEDAHKGAWDTMCEIHGRGSVTLNEANATKRWRAMSSIARVLIYYDFFTPDWYAYKRV